MRTVLALEYAGIGILPPPVLQTGPTKSIIAALADVMRHGQQHETDRTDHRLQQVITFIPLADDILLSYALDTQEIPCLIAHLFPFHYYL